MSKIILFNAPKLAGKDFAINYLGQSITLNRAECKQTLHNLVKTVFGLTPEKYWSIYEDRNLKEKPISEFKVNLGMLEYLLLERLIGRDLGLSGEVLLSIREAMIYVSEILIKPRWGKDFFGNARVNRIKELESLHFYPEPITVDGSCAFIEELEPLINYLGQDNILLIRVYREGCTYEGDSRDYIPDGVINNTVDILNNGTEEEYLHKVKSIVEEFIKCPEFLE